MTALASFTSYAISFTLGFPLVTGGAVRYWLYGSAGLSAGKVASLTVVAGVTFWLGMGLVLALGFIVDAVEIGEINHLASWANQAIGLGLFAVLFAYLVWVTRMRRQGKGVFLNFKLPGPMLTLGQTALGAIDVCSAAGALFVLLPKGHALGYMAFCCALFVCGDARHRKPLAGRARRVRGDDAQGRRRVERTSCSRRCCCFASSTISFRSCLRSRCSAPTRRCAAGAACARRWRRRRSTARTSRTPSRPREACIGSETMTAKDSGRRELSAQIRSPFAAKMIEALPTPSLIVDADDRAVAANAPARELLPGLKIGEPLVLALRSPDVIDAIRSVVATGEAETALWSERVPIERLFEVCVAPLATDAGAVVAALLTLRDLTEARRVERMRADFIANASHELRTPLASLLGFIETLQGSAQADARAREKFLAIMREQGRRMARLIDDLLSLSRIEQKQHVRPDAAVDLAQAARHVGDTLAPLAGKWASRSSSMRRRPSS